MNPITTKELDRNAIIDKLADQATEAADMRSLVRLYYDDQYNYFDSLTDDELYEFYQDYIDED